MGLLSYLLRRRPCSTNIVKDQHASKRLFNNKSKDVSRTFKANSVIFKDNKNKHIL